ncbi:hypothetical protein TCAL_14903 [Tigriopus californicus]|uniref:Uncharacterized protein n=1 Tax=Tigriopus californicus TaxID=6832 RepID=A0A553P406_TIGCA|nr:hypothetical protein TCAL_14903 [Tigriopus californicus]
MDEDQMINPQAQAAQQNNALGTGFSFGGYTPQNLLSSQTPQNLLASPAPGSPLQPRTTLRIMPRPRPPPN